jgi:hypothetical protein
MMELKPQYDNFSQKRIRFENKTISKIISLITGKSLSEALIFASINPQYDNRLFMELP